MSHIDITATISEFTTAAAAKSPTPGGGSVTALVGALAAAMGSMSMNYSIGRKTSAPYDAQLGESLHIFDRTREMFLQLVVEDQLAYASLTDARKAPKPDPIACSSALDACIQGPLAIATMASRVIDEASGVVQSSNNWLLSDLAVCCELAMATLRCAIHNVEANLLHVPGPQALETRKQYTDLLERSVKCVQRVIPEIADRMRQNAVAT